ncbi:hypothetical protein B0H14DRAFT_2574025 [Mycena olivaceomarginata]|nr:hypothetical protein B0H14DRAFT_2574025 [Mycena olivaceomarginata]
MPVAPPLFPSTIIPRPRSHRRLQHLSITNTPAKHDPQVPSISPEFWRSIMPCCRDRFQTPRSSCKVLKHPRGMTDLGTLTVAWKWLEDSELPSLLARISQRELSLATFGSAAPVTPAPGETETMIAMIAILLISYGLLSNRQVPQELQVCRLGSIYILGGYLSSVALLATRDISPSHEVFSKRSDIPVIVLAQLYLTELLLGAPTSEEMMLIPNLEPVSLPAVRIRRRRD